jgi:hypothetical protein
MTAVDKMRAKEHRNELMKEWGFTALSTSQVISSLAAYGGK